jgi:HK97 family phage portal protein
VKLFGWQIERTKAPVGVTSVAPSGGWTGLFGPMGVVRESFAGAWQRNITRSNQDVITQSTVWSCITLIAGDISKIAPRLVERDGDIWVPTENPAYSPVLREPNHYQNRINFYESWVLSKLLHGNTYVLKERDGRGVVTALHVLDTSRVTVLVAPDTSIYYQLSSDNLAGVQTDVTVPASEIIHDRWNTIYHPMCGLSPLIACWLAASQSVSIQQASSRFFQNNSKPGGVLTSPNQISQATG